MDFRGREEKFREADRRYAELKRQLDAGSISAEEFEAERQRLMVLNEGHWWAKSRETGDWHYHDGSAWVRGTPPGYQPPPTPHVESTPDRQSQLKQGEGLPSSQTTPSDSSSTRDRNERKQRRGVLSWITVATGLVGVGVVIWLLVPYVAPYVQGEIEGPPSEEVPSSATELPNVVGKSRNEAEEILNSNGFDVKADTQESSEEDEGKVLEQDPSGGEEAEENSAVAITVGEGPPKPAPGYALIEHDSGNLSVEVPSDWDERLTGFDGMFPTSGDVSPGEGVGPALTASTDLNAWVDGDHVPGTYIVASRELAQKYTVDQLVNSGFNDYSGRCEASAVQDFDHHRYSGKVQAWTCGGTSVTIYTLAAMLKSGECVVVLQVLTYSEAHRKAAEHVMDTVDADCGGMVD